jgi:ribosomal protein S18 acetylase RimI-like enzyme
MMIRLATLEDLDDIWQLRLETTKLLKERHIDQWQYEDPSIDTFKKDILNEEFYVLVDDNKIKGMMAVTSGVEDTYLRIYVGSWRLEKPYLTIHRLAVKKNLLGSQAAKQLMLFSDQVAKEKKINYMRIDTHEKNRYAIRLFESFGYHLCGWIELNQKKGDIKRLAFDKIQGENDENLG